MQVLVAFLVAVVLAFTYVLYDLQIVQGADFLARSTRKIPEVQTVPAARGAILDRYGRPLVSNRLSYNVVLNTARMGDTESKNQILFRLTQLCRAEALTWNDSLPISQYPPFYLTTGSAGNTANLRFERYLENRRTVKNDMGEALNNAFTGSQLIDWFRTYYGIPEDFSDTDARALIGLLYELELRSRFITQMSYVFAEDVSHDFIAMVKEEQLPGVTMQATTTRIYHTEYAAHLLGRVAPLDERDLEYFRALGYPMDAIVGKEGVELAFEQELHGTPGVREVETNQMGKIVSETYRTEPKPGSNVFLTLDINLQAATERILAEHMPSFPEGQGAAAVIIDVSDAGVLASASYPTYNLQTFSQDYAQLSVDPLTPMVNRAFTGRYAPGSTFKMVTAVAALETGLLTDRTLIRCTGRYTYYRESQPMCWIYRQYGGTHGALNVAQAITESCNIFFYDTGRRLGIDTLVEYATMFGLGQPTGIELHENIGAVASPAYSESRGQVWYEGNTMYAAVGQENNQFTPLQIANYIATIANGGSHYSVHLLDTVKSNDFRIVEFRHEPDLQDQLTISDSAMRAVHKGMLDVITDGSPARYFTNLGVQVAGKTGSAQIAADKEANAVFVAFAPYHNPEIALCVVVEQGGSGTEVGAIVADILSYYFTVSRTGDLPQGENTLLR
jgi:Cell division protein FtsI/penicillin-binding protein 2